MILKGDTLMKITVKEIKVICSNPTNPANG